MHSRFSSYLRLGAAALAVSGACLLTGCQSLPSGPSVSSILGAERTCPFQYGARGRFSLRYRINEREDNLHGGFDWRQTSGYTTVVMYSPTGQAVATIEVTPELTRFSAVGHEPKTAKNTEALIETELGWSLPVTGLRTWLVGCATDMNGAKFTASKDRTNVITKDGWQISYSDWTAAGSADMPRRIDLNKGSYDLKNVDLTLKLVVDEWRF